MRCSPGQVEEFFKSSMWQDVLDELKVHEEQILQELARPSWDHDSGELAYSSDGRIMQDESLRGALRMLNVVKNSFPDDLTKKSLDKEE